MNADGSPDLTFGTGGIVDSAMGGRCDAVAAGLGNELLALCNYGSTVAAALHVDAAGTASLAIGGIAEPLIDEVASPAKLVKPVFAPNGRLALIGNGGVSYSGALAVLEANGLPATSFGSAGHVLAADFGLLGAVWIDAAYQTDNQLIITGYSGSNNIVLRLDANGMPDATFGGTGIVQYQSVGGIARAATAAVQPDGMSSRQPSPLIRSSPAIHFVGSARHRIRYQRRVGPPGDTPVPERQRDHVCGRRQDPRRRCPRRPLRAIDGSSFAWLQMVCRTRRMAVAASPTSPPARI